MALNARRRIKAYSARKDSGAEWLRVIPLAMTPAFAAVSGKTSQWAGFARRLVSGTPPPELAAVIDAVAAFAGPVLLAAARGEGFSRAWPPGGPWTPDSREAR